MTKFFEIFFKVVPGSKMACYRVIVALFDMDNPVGIAVVTVVAESYDKMLM